MSDGNFNRSLLPHTDFQSGVRTGGARMRARALEAFAQALDEVFPAASDDEKVRAELVFSKALND